ncbi:unnamed protein product [Ceutorhynchus assimilis]|uniref:Chitin-binding type-2 domain-containing protein n=1 Tax=Ceutorhynchus assimilis TaxID=467358 RepID=A0A9N9MEI0_9CUCU|nr:unnamed protein product [Ceutorhynchus assimilis]
MELHTFLTISSLCIATSSSLPQNLPGYTQLASEQIQYLQKNGFGSTHKTFRPTTVAYEEEEYEDELDNSPEPTQDRQPTYATPKTTYYASVTPAGYKQAQYKPQQQQQQQYRRAGEKIAQPNNKLEEEEEEEKEEEPDRLTLLLPQSKFQCSNRKTGYYADEDLGCEVFHYCHDNARHSWICPEGFTFHQIQLICMPPSGDNICEKSSDYHFVNDYLYKPLNLEEYQQRPNISLRYSDRYFPDSYRPRYDDEEEDLRPVHHQHSVRVTNAPRYQQVQSTTFRPQSQLSQVFRSPEEINISLQQRRPQYTTAKYIDVYDKK